LLLIKLLFRLKKYGFCFLALELARHLLDFAPGKQMLLYKKPNLQMEG